MRVSPTPLLFLQILFTFLNPLWGGEKIIPVEWEEVFEKFNQAFIKENLKEIDQIFLSHFSKFKRGNFSKDHPVTLEWVKNQEWIQRLIEGEKEFGPKTLKDPSKQFDLFLSAALFYEDFGWSKTSQSYIEKMLSAISGKGISYGNRMSLAGLLFSRGDFEPCEKLLLDLKLEKAPKGENPGVVYDNLIELYLAQNQFEKGELIQIQVEKMGLQGPLHLYTRLKCLLGLGKIQVARGKIEGALNQEPLKGVNLFTAAHLEYETRNYNESMEYLNQLFASVNFAPMDPLNPFFLTEGQKLKEKVETALMNSFDFKLTQPLTESSKTLEETQEPFARRDHILQKGMENWDLGLIKKLEKLCTDFPLFLEARVLLTAFYLKSGDHPRCIAEAQSILGTPLSRFLEGFYKEHWNSLLESPRELNQKLSDERNSVHLLLLDSLEKLGQKAVWGKQLELLKKISFFDSGMEKVKSNKLNSTFK